MRHVGSEEVTVSSAWAAVCWALAMLVAGLSAPAPAQLDREAERERFRQAWAAASRGDQAQTLQAIADLPDYPLRPYLEFELLRQRVDQVPEAVMEQFLARHRDWSFHDQLMLNWLRSLGRRGEFEALRRHARQARDAEVRCYLARADLAAGATDELADRVRELWLVGRSQPSACNPLFDWWRRQHLRPDLAWQRFHLALRAGEVDLARYLRRYLDSDQRHWAELWLSLQAQPAATLAQARGWNDHEQARLIVSTGLTRLAARDWARADELWPSLARRFNFDAETRAQVERDIALYRAVGLDPGGLTAIQRLPAAQRDQQILEWQVRVALAQQEWEAVLAAIAAMDAVEQARPRWRYWRARALAANGRPEAALVYGSLAGEANYYGFLASARLGQDFSLCSQELAADAAIQRRLMRDAEFERALELHRVGLNGHARRTWQQVSARLSQAELHQAALLASAQSWHDRAIHALGAAGTLQAYPWRFPLVERGKVTESVQRWPVDPALVYGLMRAESAMQPDALSPAGARGLLQLMPGTASAVAGRHGLPYSGQADLMRPAINLPLGIAHLHELQNRFNGEWIHVAAAYNAGIGAVNRWRDSRPFVEPDIWLETLPFFETRDYVPRVLAFATIYEWLLGQPPRVLKRALLADPPNPRAGFSCTAE